MTTLNSPLTGTPYPSASSNAITSLLNVPDAVLWIEKYVNLRFTSTAARDAAIPSPEDGMQAYITGTTPRELYLYDGASAAWKLIWQSGAWQAWTPVFASGLTVGNGTLTGWFKRSQRIVECRGTFTFGSTSAITGPRLQFPTPCASAYAVNHSLAGNAFALDVSLTARNTLQPMVNDSTTGGFGAVYFMNILTGTLVAGANPFTWATGDLLSWAFSYEELS